MPLNSGNVEEADELETFLRDECIWQDASRKFTPLSLTRSYSATYFEPNALDPLQYAHHYCASTLGSGWIALRYGPFSTSGGFFWTGAFSLFNGSLLPTYRVGGIHALTAYALGNLDENNAMISYPPIHQHHFHLFGSGNPGQVVTVPVCSSLPPWP